MAPAKRARLVRLKIALVEFLDDGNGIPEETETREDFSGFPEILNLP